MMAYAAAESSPDVGSSSMMMGGREMSSMAMLRRFFCPPDSPLKKMEPTAVSAHWRSPTESISASIWASMSLLGTLWYP
jgi:hypothetical protein